MEESETTNSAPAGTKKAGPFDNLSRDDLVKKCRGLLGIAQKAKQAKDECQEENKKLKDQLTQCEMQKAADKDCLKTMQEVVDSLTDQKLKAAMRVDELEKVVVGLRRELEGAALLRDRLEKSSDTNEALQRQIKRLTDENEQLLDDLAGMENKLKDLETDKQKIELQQKQLTKVNSETVQSGREEKLIRKLKLYKNKVQEISAKILLLKSDRKILLKTVKEYSEEVPKWQKELLNASEALFNRTHTLEKENHNLKQQCASKESIEIENQKLLGEVDSLKQRLGSFSEQCQNHGNQTVALSSKLTEIMEECQNKQSELTNLQDMHHKILINNSDLEQKLQQALEEKQHLQSELGGKQIELDQIQECVQNEKAANEQLRTEYNRLTKKLEEIQTQYDMAKQIAHTRCQEEQKESEAGGLRGINELTYEMEQQELRVNQIIEEKAQLQKEMDDLQSRYSQQTDELKEKILELSEIQKKLHDMSELDATNKLLQTEVLEYDRKLQKYMQEQAELQKELSDCSVALETLQDRFNSLHAENQRLLENHVDLERQNANDREDLATVHSKFELVKLENSELLSELKEINEILKERGGVISLQLSKISELESQKAALERKLTELGSPDVEQLRKQLQEAEHLAAEKESELIVLRERERNFDAQSDAMSTSTISRAEEVARMREIDDSFEEKYNKLRSLAVKLKKKVAEQTVLLQKYEKDKESFGLGKNLQSLQAEYDKLLDTLECERQAKEHLETELKECKEHMDKQKIEIETFNQVRSEIGSNKKDKSSLESTIRDYREQLQSLKREKEAFNLAKKEIESENQKLMSALKAKEKQLNDELEAQKELKVEVEKSRLMMKKTNVLNLEMEAYEKSLAELNKKLETKKAQVQDLEGTIDAQEGTIKSLKSQMALLEQSLLSERTHSQELKKNIDVQQEKLRISEHQRGEVNVELAELKLEHERVKLIVESNRAEISETVNEKEKICAVLELEKGNLLKQVYSLESDLEEIKAKLTDKEQEAEDVKTEFASYKIRAQSVLKQNQNKDTGKERELEEETQKLRQTLERTQNKLQQFSQQTAELSKTCEELKNDKTRLQSRCKELHDLLEESRLHNESLIEDNRRCNLNNQEALRTQRLQSETLVNCYKKQLEELQEKYSREIEALQTQIRTAPRDMPDASGDSLNNNLASVARGQHYSDEQKISLLLMEREEGEGSESTSSQNAGAPGAVSQRNRKISNSSQTLRSSRSNRDLIPLDELLNASFDDASIVYDGVNDCSPPRTSTSPTFELRLAKEQLEKHESRVRHLTALLAEAEQDLAKLTQLNELLKEEVRRQERSIEREKHVQNSEYLKNVIFKFLTLNSGDEKSRLVPVLNTILKLSPEETQKLNNVAKEGGGRGWTGILWN
ncbi:GRIP and coiled-coil domain-containing protein 2 isoform X2 [Wyeomyia smithii]|uniref:GRIP and coiled-coil domain-containing protein 2 isoform X2 n=1 Tax=Wyeomyia smithii TaxID=174621 RepID=UPI002467DC09|nr:GRIP and coiled-coil domain-containing protein 2 isoform X2 [Wyeomyia smithii]